MNDQASFFVRFWGVRGSIACPGPDTVRYGGNTSCLEVRCGDHAIILDAGTGLRPLGEQLTAEAPVDCDILLSHTHFDHIVGLPFFAPLYSPESRIRLWAGHLLPDDKLHDVLCEMLIAPLFPIPFDVMSAEKTFNDFVCGETLQLASGATVRTAPLNHPNGATGYRIEYGESSICYVTDTEHREDGIDQNILSLISGTDIFIYDATYTPDEYEAHKGWGHSTWQAGLDLAEAAGVGTFVIFHHDPKHDDAFMDRVGEQATARFPGTVVAREGMVLIP